MKPRKKTRVAILGGGPAGLTTAWSLTSPEREGRFDVTIYQAGWRVGGLCATGRVPPEMWLNQNGTHYLFGAYDQALVLLRRAYDELHAAGERRFGTFEEQIIPRDLLAIKHFFNGQWTNWLLEFPRNGQRVGHAEGELSITDIATMLLGWVIGLTFGADALASLQATGPLAESAWGRAFERVRAFGASRLSGDDLAERLLSQLRFHARDSRGRIQDAIKMLRQTMRRQLAERARVDVEACRRFMLADLVFTALLGLVEDDLMDEGAFEKVDHVEFRDWLRRHGADELTLGSPIITTWYDAIAAYEGGDHRLPRVATGPTLAAMKKLFGYKGSLAYQIAWEIGDSLVAPLYATLRQRGVKFKFFHRVWDIVPAADGRSIQRVVLERQRELAGTDYDPLIEVRGRLVWPDAPRWEQLVGPPDEGLPLDSFYAPRRGPDTILEARKDFDVVVGAMGSAVYRFYGKGLAEHSDAWRETMTQVRTVETQSLRLWFRPTLSGLGWPKAPPIASCAPRPYGVWEDPTPCLASELWPDDNKPSTVAHVFGPLPAPRNAPPPEDSGYPARQQHRAEADAEAWLRNGPGILWPQVVDPLAPPALDPQHVVFQQVRANAGPEQAYTMVFPGTWKYRPPPGSTEFTNFFVCGDWTRTSTMVGTFEGAVESGFVTGGAISTAT